MKQLILSSNLLKALVRQVVHNPIEYPLMEFRYGLWAGVSSLFGEDERQLGEANTRPEICNRKVPAEIHACKYAGSRNGKLINISALRTAMTHFYPTSAISVAVRDYHLEKTGRSRLERPGIWDQYLISRAALALISYRYRATGKDPSERMPDSLASQYKLITGIFMICREMAATNNPAIIENAPVSAQVMYDFADANKVFRSENDMVCAGSRSKIIEFMELLDQGRSHAAGVKLNLNGEDAHIDVLQSLVPDIEGWYRYALLTVELDYFIELEKLRRQLKADTQASLQRHLEIYEAQYAHWLKLLDVPAGAVNENFYEGVLRRQNAILVVLNRSPVSSITKTVIDNRMNN